MPMQKAYNKTLWKNYPDDSSPVNERNLNNMENGIDENDNRIIQLDTTKFDKTEAAKLIKEISIEKATGIITITYYSGATKQIDTLLEKIAVNFDFDETTQKITITLDDGTVKEINLSSFITEYEFDDSDTIAVSVENHHVKAAVKNGSITEQHLRPDYLADIKVQAAKAEAARDAAQTAEANAKDSETAAASSATESAASAKSASDSAATATTQATSASNSAQAAKTSETNARNSATAAKASETNAGNSATSAASSATAAAKSAEGIAESEKRASDYATKAQSYAVGGTNTRPNEDTDNAEYYYGKSKEIYDEFSNTGNVTGVKGHAEEAFRHGNVDLTPEDIGALPVDGKAASATKADSAERASILSGYGLTTLGHNFDAIPLIGANGVMEVGKYIDFHTTNNSTSDYDVRITADASGLTLGGTTKGTFSGNLTGTAETSNHMKIVKLINTDFRTYMDNNSNIHHSNSEEFNVFRFYNVDNVYTTRHLPCVDSHIMAYSLENTAKHQRFFALDAKTNDIYTCGKLNGTWSDWVKVIKATDKIDADTVDGYHIQLISETAYQQLAAKDAHTIYCRYK